MAKRPAPETTENTTEATTEKPAKAPRAKKAAAPKAEKVETAPADGEKATRRHFGRGWLANSIEDLCRKHSAGKLKGYEAGQPLTVGILQSLCVNAADEMPSTGAVSAVLTRWLEDGYIKTSGKPLAFVGYTAKYKDASLDKFLEDRKARIAKEKAAAKKAA